MLEEENIQFRRQRRNLLLMSGVMLFLELSGGMFKKINVLGSEIILTKPELAMNVLFLALGYLLLRYFQYLNEIGGSGFRARFYSAVSRYIPRKAKKKAENVERNDVDVPLEDYKIIKQSFSEYVVLQDLSGLVEDDVKEIATEESEEVTLKFRELVGVFVLGLIEVVIRTPWFTEFALPPLLATTAIVKYFVNTPSIWSVAP